VSAWRSSRGDERSVTSSGRCENKWNGKCLHVYNLPVSYLQLKAASHANVQVMTQNENNWQENASLEKKKCQIETRVENISYFWLWNFPFFYFYKWEISALNADFEGETEVCLLMFCKSVVVTWSCWHAGIKIPFKSTWNTGSGSQTRASRSEASAHVRTSTTHLFVRILRHREQQKGCYTCRRASYR